MTPLGPAFTVWADQWKKRLFGNEDKDLCAPQEDRKVHQSVYRDDVVTVVVE